MTANALYVLAGFFLLLGVFTFITYAGHSGVGGNALYFVLGFGVLGGLLMIAARKARKREMDRDRTGPGE